MEQLKNDINGTIMNTNGVRRRNVNVSEILIEQDSDLLYIIFKRGK